MGQLSGDSRVPKTLYHASRHAFSVVDDAKLGAGQNLFGRGFYTSPSAIECTYFITEDGMLDFGSHGNPVDAAIYAFELKDDARILETNQAITPDFAAALQAAGEKVGNPALGRMMAENETVNSNFHLMAASADGMAILRTAGVDVLSANDYYCVINTAAIGNLRLHSASGAMLAAQNRAVQQAVDHAEEVNAAFDTLAAAQPQVGGIFRRISTAMETVAETLGKSEKTQHLQTVLKHFLTEEAETRPDPQKGILPLNRFLAEARRAFNLYDDAPMMPVIEEVNQAVAEIRAAPAPDVKQDIKAEAAAAPKFESRFAAPEAVAPVAAPVKYAQDSFFAAEAAKAKPAAEKFDGPYTVDNLFPEERVPQGLSFPDGADEKLFNAAENLVNMLNKMRRQNGMVSYELRDALVKNTAHLAAPPDSPHYREDVQKGNLGWMGHIRDQVNGAGYLHMQMKLLELGRPGSASQEAGAALRGFVEAFAQTKGASEYAALALAKDAPDADAVVARLNKSAPQAAAAKPAARHL